MGKSSKNFMSFVALMLVLLLSLTACTAPVNKSATGTQGTSTPSSTATNTPTAPVETIIPAKFNQSPYLDSMNLPKIEDRLPKEPKLTNEYPADMLDYQIGDYGGVITMGTDTIDFHADLFIMLNEALVNTTGIQGKEVTGNVLKGYEVSEDKKEFTFFLREGLKWSDGVPVTMEDFRFTFEDMLFNEELTPVIAGWMRSGGNTDGTPLKFKKVDETTFKVTFDQPYGGFLIHLSIQGWKGYTEFLKPAHYLKQFHKDMPEYNKAKADEVAKAGNFADDTQQWVNIFHRADITNWEITRKEAIGYPMLYPWTIVEANDQVYTYKRNPYYFKIDSAGNQLPYVDEIHSVLVQDIEMMTMKTLAGDFDYVNAPATLNNVALYKENEKNGYKTLMASQHITPIDIGLNMTYNDDTYKEVVRNLKFRQALNYAIDKEEMAGTLYFGYAAPTTIQDAEFNVDKANSLLDEIGMDKRDKDGYRLAPNGKPFSITVENGAEAPDIVPACELLSEMWGKVGVKTIAKRIEGSLVGNKTAANELQSRMIWTHTPLWYMQDWGYDMWGRNWSIWKSKTTEATITNEDGTTKQVKLKGEEPPEKVKDFFALVDSLLVVTPDETQPIIDKIHASMKENLWYFTFIKDVKQCMIFDKDLYNITEKGFAIGNSFGAEQFFYKK